MSLLPRLSALPQRVVRALLTQRRAAHRAAEVETDLVLYEAFAGRGMLCNPEAIFRRLLARADTAHLRHVWVISDPVARRSFREEFGDDPRVRMVARDTDAYWREVSRAGLLINNATFPPAFAPRPGQRYLNTWHGTPLKTMGFDMPDGAWESANTLRNFLLADVLLSASGFMTDTMYLDAYRLRGTGAAVILEEGYPRIDRQVVSDDERGRLLAQLAEVGIRPEGRDLVLYAPTWRGSSFQDAHADLDAIAERVEALQEQLGQRRLVVAKLHQAVAERAEWHPSLQGRIVPDNLPTNPVLGLTAALVTDYSSIFFDYLATGRPIGFLVPDGAEYRDQRGTYLDLADMPGPVSADARALGSAIRALLEGEAEHPSASAWRQRFTPHEDGGVTDRVIDAVFGGGMHTARTRSMDGDQRIRVLLYLGGMRANGITSAAITLLGALDPDRYDVTALMTLPRASDTRAQQRRVPAHVRQVFRIGGMNGDKRVHLRRHLDLRRGRHQEDDALRQMWSDEWHRIAGSLSSDVVIDFSGYSPFWSRLLLAAPAKARLIWLHNEMAADRERLVQGKPRMRRALGGVFRLYPRFDALVSVSPRLAVVNAAALDGVVDSDHFRAVRNSIDVEAVRRAAADPLPDDVPWGEALGRADNTVWFVAVGRLSPEKNQGRLLRAFAEVHREDPRARLLILGDGPLAHSLRRLVTTLTLDRVVHLAGAVDNPFPAMSRANAVVLASDYEGQPMVLLEAAALGRPIVSTAFASVSDALPRGIRIVPRSEEGLVEGLREVLAGRVEPVPFDADTYRRETAAEFDRLLETVLHREGVE